ncbi:hypothetical protein DSO57_1008887 [Entomophthora muscae]|uniref:Uncharacterized protein n=1 Tax=Entomophthora muscae TaxID=34485 RepID=A0ACC2TU70_9FUNG|nr:hypothetical protein DSO57_1008887 [Entomophthora muscae]
MLELHDQPNGDGSLFSSADSNIISQSLNNSCDHCRNRKIKCNSAKPSCSYCSRRSLPCTYSINKKKQIFSGAPLKISLNELEERIQRLEILSSNILLQQQQQRNIAHNHQISNNVTFIPDQVHSRGWSQTPLYSAIPFNPISTCLSPAQLPECPTSLPVAFTSEPLSMNYSTDTSCLPLNLNQAPNQVGGYHNFNSSFSMSHDLLGIEDLRRILLASYRSKGEFKGFANYHKSVLIELCLSSNLVMASFCALSCAHASFPFLDRSPATRRRLIDHFLSHAKSLLVQEGYSNPSIATIQAVLLIGIVEYEKGRFERCISYHQSAFCMACVVGLPQLDVARMGTVTSEGATERKNVVGDFHYGAVCSIYVIRGARCHT